MAAGLPPSSCSFLVTINSRDDVIVHFRIANEGDLSKKQRADRI